MGRGHIENKAGCHNAAATVKQYINPRQSGQGAKSARSFLPSADEIGFTTGERVVFNPNKCIAYLKKICELFIMEDGTLSIYNYAQGIWEELTEALLGTILMYLMNHALPNSWRGKYEVDVFGGLRRTAPKGGDKLRQDNLISLNNGVFDVETKTLIPHDSKYLFRSKSPVMHQKEAQCPQFLSALRDIFCGDEALIGVMQEIFGNCLLESSKAERAFLWYGPGANGKSVVADLLIALVGRENVSHIPLSNFSERFGLEGIINKKVNICAENEIKSTVDTEALKSIISGDVLNVSRKFKTDLSIRPTTKLIFLMNTLPNLSDLSHGFYRKIMVVPFNRIFKPEEMDKDLREKLLGEMEGILNWALQGAVRLIENRFNFSESQAMLQATKAYQLEQNPVAQFFSEMLRPKPDGKEARKDILHAYQVWLVEQSISAKGTDSPQKFWEALNHAAKATGAGSLEYSKSNGKRYLRGYQLQKRPGLSMFLKNGQGKAGK